MSEEKKEKEIKLSENAKKVMEMVEKMNVLELNDLVHALEEKFGVSANAPVMMAGSGAAVAPTEAAEEKTEFDVVLVDGGANKINVIKAFPLKTIMS